MNRTRSSSGFSLIELIVAMGVLLVVSSIVTTPPPNTQGLIGQAPLCVDDMGADIPGTACIMFNSRGVPVGNGPAFAPIGTYALYVTDGSAVYGVTIAATGLFRMWRTLPVAIPEWVRN